MIDEMPEPPRQVLHFGLLVLVCFVTIGSLFLSGRPVALAGYNNVAPARAVPAGLLPDYGKDWSAIIHRSDWNPHVAALLGHADLPGAGGVVRARPPRLGWVIREWSLFSLPLVGYRQSGPVVFKESGYGYVLVGLTDAQLQAVERAGGAGWFPFWRYCWGWLVIGMIAAFAWAELRWQARRRALLGLI